MRASIGLVFISGLVMFGQDIDSKRIASASAPNRMEIVLERLSGAKWSPVDPGLVLKQSDRIRFRFRSNFDGYLYVSDRGTSGSYSMLFPGPETGTDNRISQGKDYLIPATQTHFRIGGPAGHDIVYWMISPVVIGEAASIPPAGGSIDHSAAMAMTPRCDDALFRARGECIDSSAGPRPRTTRDLTPDQKDPPPNAQHLLFQKRQNTTLISSPGGLSGPVVYEFHLAHE